MGVKNIKLATEKEKTSNDSKSRKGDIVEYVIYFIEKGDATVVLVHTLMYFRVLGRQDEFPKTTAEMKLERKIFLQRFRNII